MTKTNIKFKLIITTVLICCCIIGGTAYAAPITTDDNYIIADDAVQNPAVISGFATGLGGAITMPATSDHTGTAATYTLVALGDGIIPMTKVDTITSVAFGSNITTLNNYAFEGFADMTSVTLSSGLTTVGAGPFKGCTTLATIDVNGNTAFQYNSGVLLNGAGNTIYFYSPTLVDATYTIPATVATIWPGSFYGCTSLTSIDIPTSVTSIGSEAFYGCSGVTSVTIPSSVVTIDTDAFANMGTGFTIIGLPGSAADTYATANGITFQSIYTFDALSGTITDYLGVEDTLTIPTQIGGVDVLAIGTGAFSGATFTSITLPTTLTSIGITAFYGCANITSITIPDTVASIDDGAFLDCTTLASVTMPTGLLSIGIGAFSGCSSLASITIPANVATIGGGAFNLCDSMTAINVDVANTTFASDSGVLIDSSNVLVKYPAGKTATSYTVPSSITSLGASAFYAATCAMTDILIPSTVTSIGADCFGIDPFKGALTIHGVTGSISNTYATAETITFSASIVVDNGYEFNKFTNTIIGYTGTATVLTIPSIIDGVAVQAIGDYAFQNYTTLTDVTIPSSITSIGDYAFSCLSGTAGSITTVTLPNTMQTIGEGAFANQAMTNINIPASVSSLGYNMLFLCRNLQSVTVDGANANYMSDGGVLFDKAQTTLYNYPEAKTGTTYAVPTMVLAISDYAFIYSDLTTITMDNTVSSIGDYAFFSNTLLTSITLSTSITSISEATFGACIALPTVAIPTGVSLIDEAAFYGCDAMTSITLPTTVTTLGESVFESSGLTSIDIPASVTTIGDDAFLNALSLATITVNSANTAYQAIAGVLFNKAGTTLIKYPDAKTGTSYTVPAAVATIAPRAFDIAFSSPLTAVTIDTTVTTIDFDNFSYNVANMSISGYNSSDAHLFALAKGITFISLDASTTITIQFSGWTIYKTTIYKKPYYLGGKVESNAPFTQVQVRVKNASGSFEIDESVTLSNVMSYEMTGMNSQVKMESLTLGKKTIYIVVTNALGVFTIYEADFEVVESTTTSTTTDDDDDDSSSSGSSTTSTPTSSATIAFSGWSMADSILEGQSYSIWGNIISNTEMASLSAKIVNSSGKVQSEKSVSVKSKTYEFSGASSNLSSKLSFSSLDPGRYDLILTASFEKGTKTVYKKSFSVLSNDGLGTISTLSANKTLYKTSDDVSLSWKKCDNATSYELYFTKDGEFLKKETVTGTSFKASLSDMGEYSVCIHAVNKTDRKKGNYVYFSVNDSTEYTPVTALTVSADNYVISVCDTMKLTCSITPINASTKSISWKSDDPEIASVDHNGRVTAHKKGKTTITASSADGVASNDYDISVVETDFTQVKFVSSSSLILFDKPAADSTTSSVLSIGQEITVTKLTVSDDNAQYWAYVTSGDQSGWVLFSQLTDIKINFVGQSGMHLNQAGIPKPGGSYIACYAMLLNNLGQSVTAHDVFRQSGNSVVVNHDAIAVKNKMDYISIASNWIGAKEAAASLPADMYEQIVSAYDKYPQGVIVNFITSEGVSHAMLVTGYDALTVMFHDPASKSEAGVPFEETVVYGRSVTSFDICTLK